MNNEKVPTGREIFFHCRCQAPRAAYFRCMGRTIQTRGKYEDPSALIGRLARRLRDVRDAKGMSRRVLSEKSNISQRYLAQLEAGKGNISVSLLERVAQALGVPMHALIVPNLAVDREAQEIAALYETAPSNTRHEVKKLLNAPRDARPSA